MKRAGITGLAFAIPAIIFFNLPNRILDSAIAYFFFPFIYPGFLISFLIFGGHGDGGNWFAILAVFANFFVWTAIAYGAISIWRRHKARA